MIKIIASRILKNTYFRNFFNLNWNHYYDYTFDFGFSKNNKNAIKEIIKRKKWNSRMISSVEFLNSYFSKKNMKNIIPASNYIYQNRSLILPIINCFYKKKMNILDIGGGNLPIANCIKGTTNLITNSTVLEITELVKYVNKNYYNDLKKKNINYVYNLKNINLKKYDVAYFGSSIQYLNNYKKLLKKIFLSKIDIIIIADTFFNYTKDDFCCYQFQGRKFLYPNTFFSFKSFVKNFEQNNYKMIFHSNGKKGVYRHKSLLENEYDYKTLIFKKNK